MLKDWTEDRATYQYKVIYELVMSHIAMKIVWDTHSQKVASAYVTIQGKNFSEIVINEDITIDGAKQRMIWAAINVGSSYLVKKDLDADYKIGLIKDLELLYKSREDKIKEEKEQLRNMLKSIKDRK